MGKARLLVTIGLFLLSAGAGWTGIALGAEKEPPNARPDQEERGESLNDEQTGHGGKSRAGASTLQGGQRLAPKEKSSEELKRLKVIRVTRKPPKTVVLPGAGERPAEEILPLAGKLMGRTVRIENQRVRDTKVEISSDLAGLDVSLEEVIILLAAHKVYLFKVTDPKEGPIVVASKNPQWRDEPPRYTTVIAVPPKDFGRVLQRIQKMAAKKNARLAPQDEGIVVVFSERSGKIFVRSSRKEDIEEASAVVQEKAQKDPARQRLYTYQGSYRRADDLRDDVLERLKEADRERLHWVVASRGNRLYYRCPANLGEQVMELLKRLDTKE